VPYSHGEDVMGKDDFQSIEIRIDFSPLNGMLEQIRKMENVPIDSIIAEKIMPKALQLVVNSARSNAPVDKGYLSDSIIQKVISYQDGKVVVGIVGSENRVFETVERVSRKNIAERIGRRGKNKGRVLNSGKVIGQIYIAKIRPSKYFHLIERGHALKSGRGRYPGQYFLQRAIDSNKETMLQIMQDAFQKIIDAGKFES